LFLKDEIDDLNKMKLSCEQELKDNVPDPIIEVVSEVVPEESKPVENVTKAPRKKRKSSKDPSGKVEDKVVKEPKKKITRPDRDPTTKIGRAALDIAERKRKHREKISK
jgi:hypothetical protein